MRYYITRTVKSELDLPHERGFVNEYTIFTSKTHRNSRWRVTSYVCRRCGGKLTDVSINHVYEFLMRKTSSKRKLGVFHFDPEDIERCRLMKFIVDGPKL